MEIGIIGQGFVGSAIKAGLENYYQINTYDVKTELASCETLLDVVVSSQIVFVCLPTPMNSDGSCDTSLVRTVVSEVDQACFISDLTGRTVVIKSTVPPGTTADLDAQCSNISVVFSPEFLTEANSFEDFKNQARIIIGGQRPGTSIVKTMFKKAFPKIPIIKTGSRTAESVKYFTNCFLATKVSFANEMKQICDKIDVDFDKVVEYALYDDRIGKSHLSVPGPDGNLGFGGHCFPKDLKAIMSLAEDLGVQPSVTSAVWAKNLEVRKSENRDWERMIGRAVTKEDGR